MNIEIKGSPEDLKRICTFLNNNTIKSEIFDDQGNHSMEYSRQYRELSERQKGDVVQGHHGKDLAFFEYSFYG